MRCTGVPMLPLLAVLLVPAAAAAQTSRSSIASACRADIQKLCPGMQLGGGRIAACLQGKANQLSAGCRDALSQARTRRQAQ